MIANSFVFLFQLHLEYLWQNALTAQVYCPCMTRGVWRVWKLPCRNSTKNPIMHPTLNWWKWEGSGHRWRFSNLGEAWIFCASKLAEMLLAAKVRVHASFHSKVEMQLVINDGESTPKELIPQLLIAQLPLVYSSTGIDSRCWLHCCDWNHSNVFQRAGAVAETMS